MILSTHTRQIFKMSFSNQLPSIFDNTPQNTNLTVLRFDIHNSNLKSFPDLNHEPEEPVTITNENLRAVLRPDAIIGIEADTASEEASREPDLLFLAMFNHHLGHENWAHMARILTMGAPATTDEPTFSVARSDIHGDDVLVYSMNNEDNNIHGDLARVRTSSFSSLPDLVPGPSEDVLPQGNEHDSFQTADFDHINIALDGNQGGSSLGSQSPVNPGNRDSSSSEADIDDEVESGIEIGDEEVERISEDSR